MKNLENGTEFIWPKEKFLNRLYLMKEMYNNYEEEEDDWDLPEVNRQKDRKTYIRTEEHKFIITEMQKRQKDRKTERQKHKDRKT
jgi:hypothetical protein